MAPDRTRRRQPACKECRYQKIRCDAEPPEPCSRCRRMDLACLIAPTPGARHTKAQLQRQLEVARSRAGDERLASGAEGAEGPPPRGTSRSTAMSATPMPGAHAASASALASTSVPVSETDLSQAGLLPTRSLLTPTMASISAGSCQGQSPLGVANGAFDEAECSAQLLDGQEISSRKIRDCFALFFDFYSPFLPILSAHTSPNEHFRQSPFLFWTIVYLGSRRYAGDPTLLGLLAPKINSMAFMALDSPRTRPIQTIQGILFLCLWPVPVNTMHRDISLVLSGAALHLAMQIGLHVSGVGQDFARTVVRGSESERAHRARLWRYCCAIYHCTGLQDGIMPLGLNDTASWASQENEAGACGTPRESELWFRDRVHDIMMCATVALKQINYSRTMHQSQDSTLLSCVSLFDAQFLKLSQLARTTLDSVYLQSYHLHLLAYHFLVSPSSRQLEGFIRLYSLACDLLHTLCIQKDAAGRSSETPILKYCPIFILRALTLAAMSLLKIHRSTELAPHLDLERGEKVYFAAIVTTKELSLQNDDLCARGAAILSQLWNSKSIFRTKDGKVDSLGSRVRNRLSMSVVFDCLWWWRQEFGGQGNPYVEESRLQTERTSPVLSVAEGAETATEQSLPREEYLNFTGHPHIGGPEGEAFGFTDESFPDYDWAMSLNLNELLA